MSSDARKVTAFDQAQLDLGMSARRCSAQLLLLITPTGGIEHYSKTPMNLACCDAQAHLAWVLPVDAKRLRREPSDDVTVELFDAIWRQLDAGIDQGAAGGTFWEPPCAVGRRPPGTDYWVEYEKRRPWLELTDLPGTSLRILVPCTASDLKRRGSRLQHDIAGTTIHPSGEATILQSIDKALELAHFAVLDPRAEPGWSAVGYLDPAALPAARRAFRRFPQRGIDKRVLCR